MPLSTLPGWAFEFKTLLNPKMKYVQVAGVAANTNIAVANIKAADEILVCFNATTGLQVADAGFPKVTSAGNIQFTAVTTGSNFIVGYFVR